MKLINTAFIAALSSASIGSVGITEREPTRKNLFYSRHTGLTQKFKMGSPAEAPIDLGGHRQRRSKSEAKKAHAKARLKGRRGN